MITCLRRAASVSMICSCTMGMAHRIADIAECSPIGAYLIETCAGNGERNLTLHVLPTRWNGCNPVVIVCNAAPPNSHLEFLGTGFTYP